MNRIAVSLVTLIALASCNREEKAPEKKSETPALPQGTAPAATPSGPDKIPTAAEANAAIEALKAMAGNRAAKVSAKVSAMTLTNAVEQYALDYDRLPQPASATKGMDCVTDSGGEAGIVAVVKGKDESQNPKKIDFIGDLNAAKSAGGKYTDGLKVDGEKMALYDPWGKPYHMALDLDGDGNIADPSAAPFLAKKKVLVWSDGPDGKQDTWQDNVCSWKD